MAKVKLIVKKIMSLFLVGAIVLAPVNVNRCFAVKNAEKVKQEKLEKQLKEIEAKYAKEESIGVLEGLACVAVGCLILGGIWMANKATFPEEAEAIEQFLGKGCKFVWKGTKFAANGVFKFAKGFCDPKDFKDNLAVVGAASIVYFSLKICNSIYNKVKGWLED